METHQPSLIHGKSTLTCMALLARLHDDSDNIICCDFAMGGIHTMVENEEMMTRFAIENNEELIEILINDNELEERMNK